MPFSVSQQELLLAVANEDLQGPSQTYTQSRAVNNRLPDSSLETIPAPSSSFIEALRQLEPDAYAFQTVQASTEYHAANAMVVDHQASIFVVEDDSPDTKLLWKRGPASPIILEDDLLDPELPSKKRPASPIILEDDLPKRKSDNRYPHQTYPVDNHAEFSFNNGRESPRAGNISRSLSRTTTGSTSFRSVGTEVNESFVTESSTPPSFGIERSKGISITCKEKLTVLTKSQRFAQGLVQNSPFISKAEYSISISHPI